MPPLAVGSPATTAIWPLTTVVGLFAGCLEREHPHGVQYSGGHAKHWPIPTYPRSRWSMLQSDPPNNGQAGVDGGVLQALLQLFVRGARTASDAPPEGMVCHSRVCKKEPGVPVVTGTVGMRLAGMQVGSGTAACHPHPVARFQRPNLAMGTATVSTGTRSNKATPPPGNRWAVGMNADRCYRRPDR